MVFRSVTVKSLAAWLLLISVFSTSNAQQKHLSRSQTKEAERLLSQMGYWVGPVDGSFDAETKSALITFQKWEGRTTTGVLTLEEIDAIRLGDMPKPRDPGYEHVEIDLDRQVLLIINNQDEVRIFPVSTGSGKEFTDDRQTSVAYTPRGRFVVYDKISGWETGPIGRMYYPNYISGGVAIHGSRNVPVQPESHGCIRIPMFVAPDVSKLLPLGTIVLVYDKISFVSARAWAENPKLKQAASIE